MGRISVKVSSVRNNFPPTHPQKNAGVGIPECFAHQEEWQRRENLALQAGKCQQNQATEKSLLYGLNIKKRVGSMNNGWSGRRQAEQWEDQPKHFPLRVIGRKHWIGWMAPSDGCF